MMKIITYLMSMTMYLMKSIMYLMMMIKYLMRMTMYLMRMITYLMRMITYAMRAWNTKPIQARHQTSMAVSPGPLLGRLERILTLVLVGSVQDYTVEDPYLGKLT